MIDASLGEFLSTFTTDFNGLMTKIDQMQENMSQLKEERVKSQADLQRAQELNPASPLKKNSGPLITNQQSTTGKKNPNDAAFTFNASI